MTQGLWYLSSKIKGITFGYILQVQQFNKYSNVF